MSTEYIVYSGAKSEDDHARFALAVYNELGKADTTQEKLLKMYRQTIKQARVTYMGENGSATVREVAVHWMCSALAPERVDGRTWKSEKYNSEKRVEYARKLYSIPLIRKMIFDDDELVYHARRGFARRKDRAFADDTLVVRRPIVDIMKEYLRRQPEQESATRVQVHHSLAPSNTDKMKEMALLSKVATQLPIAAFKHKEGKDNSSWLQKNESEYCVHVFIQLAAISKEKALDSIEAWQKDGARLRVAILGGNTDVVKKIVQMAPKPKENNTVSNIKYVGLAMRSPAGSVEMLKILTDVPSFASLYGAIRVPVKVPRTINIPVEMYSHVPLFFCIAHQRNPHVFAQMLSMFLATKKDILDQHPKDGNFVLYAAIHTTNKLAIRWLLERTTSVREWKWKEFETPIHYAIRAKNYTFVEVAKQVLDSCGSVLANMHMMSSTFGPIPISISALARTDRRTKKLFL
jgi:hypothetical protein